jgi:two-component system sensor histidine kinase YesM
VKQLNLTSIKLFGTVNQAMDTQTGFEMKGLDKGIEHPVLVVNFDEAVLGDIFRKSVDLADSSFAIFSADGNVVSSSSSDTIATRQAPDWLDAALQGKSGTLVRRIEGKDMLVCYDTMASTGWISAIVTPVDSLLSTLPTVRFYTVYLGIALALLSILFAFLISGRIVKPLQRLLAGIGRMSGGDFATQVPVGGRDEMGLLTDNFNDMNQKIQKLIEENYESKIREKEAQIMALNLQLNPHFMSNTLNTIHWMAIENDQKEISDMIVSLATMFSYSIRNVKETVRFSADFEWLKSYVHIMSNRYPGLFATEYDIDPALLGQTVPTLFLQPFVENAIIHGFACKEDVGRIRILGGLADGGCFFRVEDDGKGMTDEEIARAMRKDGESIGIRNVDRRVKLIFGETYGVSIRSVVGGGTQVEIRMPYRPVDETPDRPARKANGETAS